MYDYIETIAACAFEKPCAVRHRQFNLYDLIRLTMLTVKLPIELWQRLFKPILQNVFDEVIFKHDKR